MCFLFSGNRSKEFDEKGGTIVTGKKYLKVKKKTLVAALAIVLAASGASAAGLSDLGGSVTTAYAASAKTGVIKASVGNWYYYVKGKVTAGPTIQKNSNGWWYIDQNG